MQQPTGTTEPRLRSPTLSRFVDALRDLYARGGIDAVIRLCEATAGGRPGDAAALGSCATDTLPQVADEDALFEQLLDALDAAFQLGGLEHAVAQLAQLGRSGVLRARLHPPGRLAARRRRPSARPSLEANRSLVAARPA